MAFDESNGGTGMYMPVAPAYGGGYGGGLFGNNGDFAWIVILALLFGGGWGMGGFGGFGGMMGGFGGMYEFPWLLNGQAAINANTNAGFDHAATQSAIGNLSTAVTSGFGDVQTALCGGFAGVNATVNGAQNAIAQQLYTNQIADMERSFAAQTASTAGLTNISAQLANCCCENRAATQDVKYTIATEACATRAANTANTQAILDKLCALELDNAKREASDLRQQLNMAQLAASQTAQNAFISQGFANEVDALYNRLNSCPIPATPVYGRTAIFQCNNTGCGCGNNGFVN